VDDVMQDVSAAAWQSPSRPVQQSKVAPWLYRVTLRRCLTHRRTQGRRRRFLERMVSFYPRNAESTESAWDWLMGTERTLAVRQALQELNPTDRDIFVLKHTENWTYQQLADRLGCTVATIEYRLLRARRQLRKELAALGMAGSPS
jgi:RNA polymerase sigma-70 factor (ECF subfamily)